MVVALTRLYHVQRVKRASTRVKSTYEASYTVAWHAREEAKRSENFRILLPYLSLSLSSMRRVEEILIYEEGRISRNTFLGRLARREGRVI